MNDIQKHDSHTLKHKILSIIAILIPESVKLIIDCSEKPRDNALFYAFQVFKLFTQPPG